MYLTIIFLTFNTSEESEHWGEQRSRSSRVSPLQSEEEMQEENIRHISSLLSSCMYTILASDGRKEDLK